MNLSELSVQYRESGEACKSRVLELSLALSKDGLSEMEKLLIRRRITILTAMGRDTIATSNYLSRYYTRAAGRRAKRRSVR